MNNNFPPPPILTRGPRGPPLAPLTNRNINMGPHYNHRPNARTVPPPLSDPFANPPLFPAPLQRTSRHVFNPILTHNNVVPNFVPKFVPLARTSFTNGPPPLPPRLTRSNGRRGRSGSRNRNRAVRLLAARARRSRSGSRSGTRQKKQKK